jgi:hypothetical protein
MDNTILTENFDLGKRSLTVDMDRPRELVYTLGSFRAMEDLAHRWAKKNQIPIRDLVGPEIIPMGMIGNDRPIMNPAIIGTHVIMNNLGDDNFLSIALWGALRKESPQMGIDEVDVIYEAFLSKVGDRQDLVDILLEVYSRAKNPRKLLEVKEQMKKEAENLSNPGAGETLPGEAM